MLALSAFSAISLERSIPRRSLRTYACDVFSIEDINLLIGTIEYNHSVSVSRIRSVGRQSRLGLVADCRV